MRITIISIAFVAALATARAADAQTAQPNEALAAAVRAAETAFAKTMADRDYSAFGGFIADEAVFFGQSALRGKPAIVAAWKAFFDGPRAPFSWAPETVEVLQSGGLALTSGPVRDPDGRQTGTFSTIWRREADGRWRVVFDKGCSCGR